MSELRFAQGKLDEAQFARAAAAFPKMDDRNIAIARAYLVAPGKHQITIAQELGIGRQLVQKHCKRIYEAHRRLAGLTTPKD